MGINRAWENIKENIKTSGKESLGLYELKQHQLWFSEECLRFLDQRKLVIIHWLQDPNQSGVDNINDVRYIAGRDFRNKKKEYLKAKIDALETNSKIKNIRDFCRGISDFKRDYHQPRVNTVRMSRVIWLQASTVFWLSGGTISLSS
jgi:hypothetical protein